MNNNWHNPEPAVVTLRELYLQFKEWLLEIACPAIKKWWLTERVKTTKIHANLKNRSILNDDDSTNPLRPHNLSPQQMQEDNNRQSYESLHRYINDCQRMETQQRHNDDYWNHYHNR
jgi:hypothetical protein